MKNYILAIVIGTLSSVSIAQSNVQIYGKMRLYQEVHQPGDGSSVNKQTNDGSRIGFKGSEDLGNGLKANFVIETNVLADSPSSSTLGDRQSTVGLSNSLGSINLGRDKNAVTRTYDKYDVFGNAAFSGVGSVHTNQGGRFNNGAYVEFKAGDFSAGVQYSESEIKGVSNPYSGSLSFSNKSLGIALAKFDNRDTNKSDVIAASYNLEQTRTRLSFLYSKDTVKAVETTGKTFGVIQKLNGPVSLVASYGENENVKFTAVGLNYTLSKRTTLSVRVLDQDHNVDNKDYKRYAFGIDHNF